MPAILVHMEKFKVKYKKIMNISRALPDGKLAELFLSLIQIRGAKTFTDRQLEIIKEIADLVGFDVSIRI